MKHGEFDEQDEQNNQDEHAEFERKFLAERIERELERRERERLFEEDSKIEDTQYDWWCQVSRLYLMSRNDHAMIYCFNHPAGSSLSPVCFLCGYHSTFRLVVSNPFKS